MTYSVVIPAYNESNRIRPTLDEILRYVGERNWDVEILVVDDGSRDDTPAIVREYGRPHPQVQLVQNPGNRGKGFSVRNGMLHARGDICLFTDADLSSPIGEAEKLFEAIRQGADIAIGSRWLSAELQTERQPLYRQVFGRIFNLLLRLVLGLHFMDTQCGFKAFRRDAAQRIFPRQKIERWGFDPEILFLAPARWDCGRWKFRWFGHTAKVRGCIPFATVSACLAMSCGSAGTRSPGAYSARPVASPGRL